MGGGEALNLASCPFLSLAAERSKHPNVNVASERLLEGKDGQA
jgi:hypothetical protein